MKLSTAQIRNKVSRGFTLIELLVVIGILGILAAALVATIDPFEQLKKAQDANTQNALVEYINSITRYYTTHSAFPWDTTANNGAGCNSNTAPSASALSAAGMVTCTTALIGDNELKSAFSSSASLPLIFITYDATNTQTIGCYNPKSKSGLNNSNTKYSSAGVDLSGSTCSTANKASNPTSCYWCTR